MANSLSSPSTPLLSTRGLSISFRGVKVLDHIDLTLSSGEIVTLIGLNGAGKTTLVRCLLGLLSPHSGQIIYHRRPLRLGYCPQHIHIDPTLPLSVARFLALGRQFSRSQTLSVLEEVGGQNLLDQHVNTLSGGEWQRIMLARALLHDPDLLILDEPISQVDLSGRGALYQLINRPRQKRGCGVLMVSHDLHVVMGATDRVICLNHHICCSGPPQNVATDPAFEALFGQNLAQSLALYHHHHDHDHSLHGETIPAHAP